MKISVLQSMVTADKSCAKQRMLQAGLEPPRVDWSLPRAPSAPTAMWVFALSFQQALKWSQEHPFSHVEWAGSCQRRTGKLLLAGRRAGAAGRGGQSSSRATSQELSPCRGDGGWGQTLGEGHGPLPGSVPAQLRRGCPAGQGSSGACLASPLWYSLQHCRQLPTHSSPELLTSLLVLPGSQ